MTRLGDLTARQWKSGIAAWLGWLFDGLDMHLYTVVATPLVAQLLHATGPKDPAVGFYSSLIQAAFLTGWALGGGFFGRLGDRLGRARALMLTILTYASCTGLGFLAQTWWQLMIFRFLAALGIGGEWAVGAALLAETWPKQWRPWIAATLQTGVNLRRAPGHGRGLAAVANPLRRLPSLSASGGLPGRRAAGLAGALDPPGRARARRVADGPGPRPGSTPRAAGPRPVPRRRAPHHALDDGRLRPVADGPLGLPLLVPAAPEQPPGRLPHAGRDHADQEPRHDPVDGHFDSRQLPGRGRRPAAGIPPHDCPILPGLLPGHDAHLQHAPHLPDALGAFPGDQRHRRLPGGFWAVHDVLAAAVSHAPADHRRRFLLQHRPHRGRRRHGVFWPVLPTSATTVWRCSTPACSSCRPPPFRSGSASRPTKSPLPWKTVATWSP